MLATLLIVLGGILLLIGMVVLILAFTPRHKDVRLDLITVGLVLMIIGSLAFVVVGKFN